MTSTAFAPAVLNVDLDALARNYRTLETVTGRPVNPVVKADGYGLGAAAVTKRLMAEGARTFFVARAAEGVRLREAIGPEPVIYILDGCHGDAAAMLKASSLRPVINHPTQLQTWQAAGGGACALQLDTGMNRLGFRVEDAPEPFEGLELVMTHLACADEPSNPLNRAQRDAYAAAVTRYPGVTHSFANSGGCFLGPDFAFDVVRPGICLYGGGPEGRPHEKIAPVASLIAQAVQVRDVPAGETVGYSQGYKAETPMRVATVGAGYADGVLRSYSPRGQVFIAGEMRPIIGRVSMDVLAVDVTGLDVQAGDPVELYGANRLIDDAATAAGTISYELLTSITPRVPRVYKG
ncbi:alanine racemase [Brevundimonas guildfordensis]|uniref:Alanine racemase n=1 Tax=Brevundimonas guildfordensis TaxID=2762241 RepID=A0ABR8QYQ0_9CAUL|nr:alanine racemase [Brevundimonas guildfordensis]MBD7940641.1 alanine racemase [Brevundimonas guildfordensis]